MKTILIHGDSLSWGIIPDTRKRFALDERCVGLEQALRQAAAELGCHFFDAGSVTSSSVVDRVRLDADQHGKLGHAVCGAVATILKQCIALTKAAGGGENKGASLYGLNRQRKQYIVPEWRNWQTR